MGAFDDLIPRNAPDLTRAPVTGAFADLIPVQNTPLVKNMKKMAGAPYLMSRAAEIPQKMQQRGDFRLRAEDIAQMLEPELQAFGEVAPAVPAFIPFNVATNMAIQAQETGANVPKLLRAGADALPFTKAAQVADKKGMRAILQEPSLTAPANLRAPRDLLLNAIKAVNPNFKEPEGIVPGLALDVGAGILTGAPQVGAMKAAQGAARADLKAALEALKANPERKLKNLMKGAPKQLPAPENLGEGFEVVPREEALRRINEVIRAKVQTGTSGPKGIPAEPAPAPAAPAKKLPSVRQYFTPQKNLDDAGKVTETEALKFFEEKQDDALKAYQERIKKEFGTDRVISGDEAKFIVPGVKSETMAAVHEPASSFAKVYGEKLLSDEATKAKPAMIMAGGSGSGKTRSIRSALDLDGYAAVFDTNSNNLAAVEKNISKIKKTGRPVEIVYVERDPVEAWQSVISRGQRTGRPVPADIHIKNQGSRDTVREVVKLYKADPDVKVRVLLNKEGEPISEVPLATFLKKKYTSISSEKLKGKLHEVLEEKIKAGQLTEEEALPYRFREEKPSAGQSLGQSVAEYPEGFRPGNNQAGTGRAQESSKALTPKQKLLEDIDAAIAAAPERETPSRVTFNSSLPKSERPPVAKPAEYGSVDFKVGKASASIQNTKEALQDFRARVESGFRSRNEKLKGMGEKKKLIKLNDQLGFARIRKSYEQMSAAEQRAEIELLEEAAGRRKRPAVVPVKYFRGTAAEGEGIEASFNSGKSVFVTSKRSSAKFWAEARSYKGRKPGGPGSVHDYNYPYPPKIESKFADDVVQAMKKTNPEVFKTSKWLDDVGPSMDDAKFDETALQELAAAFPKETTNAIRKLGLDGIFTRERDGGIDVLLAPPRKRVLDQLGFARVKKNLAGMTEAEQRAEVSRLRDKALAGGQKERKFIATVRNAPKTEEEVGQKILGTYKPITNKETLDLANARISKSVDDAVGYVKNTRAPTAESNATGILLIDKFQKEGNYNAAIDLVEDIAAKATKQGQAIQALSMYSKLTPEGVLKFAQRQFDKATEKLVGKARLTEDEISKLPGSVQKKVRALKLTPQLGQKLTAQAKAVQGSGTPRQRAINTARLLKQVQQQVPVSLWDKVAFTQTLMQLLNPKTAIRNIVGNAGFTALENVSDVVAAAFDRAVSLATGKRSKVLPSLRVQARGAMKGAREAVQDIDAGIRTSQANTQFQLPQSGIFKSRVGQTLEKVLRYELEVADRAAFKAAYRGSLLNQMKAAGLKRYTPEMVERAVQDGLYRTFQDDNVISQAFSRIKRSLNKLSSKVTGTERFGLGDAVIKYPKTPGAILDRGIDYSPAGFFNTVFELSKPLTGKPFNQKAFVESAARAFTGSSLVGTGIILAKLGLITGRKDDKPGIRDLKRQIGLGNYKINVSGLKRFVLSGFDPDEAQLKKGDRLETYDWFQPQAIAIAIGANIEENKGKAQGVAGTIAEAVGSGTTTLAEQPLVSGISRMFGYGDVVEGLGETLKGVPASFTPTLLNQIRLVVDDIRRNPDADDPSQESMNLVKMKVPGLASALPAKTEPLGGTSRIFKNNEGVGERAFNAFLNPSNSTRYGTDPATREAEELIKYDVPVGKQSKTLKGIDITAAERSAIDRMTGPIAKSLLQAVISRPEYQKADPLAKQKMLEALVQKSKTVSQTANVPAIARRLVGKKKDAS